ncbi:MAG: cysteine desulfurase/selenocysteine lyase [Candidatus Omnitrophota bacterium]|jgi:cysteine desulfurase/selenocysteine lyase
MSAHKGIVTKQNNAKVFAFETMKQQFPLHSEGARNERLIYFDNAATTQKPRTVIDRITQFYKHENATTHRGVYALSQESTNYYEEVRHKCANFINANSPDQIIFLRGTTEAINLVANSYGNTNIGVGDEVLISELEHHANIVPWQQLCLRTGAHLKIIPILDDGSVDLEAYSNLLSSKTKLVALAHISNVLGTVLPIKEMIAEAHQAGAVVIIDGAQGIAHAEVDVQDLNADFYCFSGHKIYGPTGIGVLYGKKALLDAMPPYQCGGSMIETVTFEKTTFAKVPDKFEAGTQAIAQIIGLGTALDFVDSVGLNRIQTHETMLLDYAVKAMQVMSDIQLIGTAPNKASIISFVMDDIHPHDVGTILDQNGIAVRAGHHCAQPTMKHYKVAATVRISFGMYNSTQEIDLFLSALDQVRRIMR